MDDFLPSDSRKTLFCCENKDKESAKDYASVGKLGLNPKSWQAQHRKRAGEEMSIEKNANDELLEQIQQAALGMAAPSGCIGLLCLEYAEPQKRCAW